MKLNKVLFYKNILLINILLTTFIAKIGLNLGLHILVALAWRLALYPSLKINLKYFGKKKLIVLAKSGGVEDIEAAFYEKKPRYPVLFLPRKILYLSTKFFLQNKVTDFNPKFNDTKLEKSKKNYRKHLIKVLFWFKKFSGVSAFAQFNILYAGERDLAIACNETNITFISTHKECMWSKGNIEPLTKLYENSARTYRGHAISVYSSVFKNIFLKSGIVDNNKIHVIGCPRLDESHRLRTTNQKLFKKTVVYYLIEIYAGPLILNFENEEKVWGIPFKDGSVGTWSEMVDKVNKSLIGLANDHPEINFIFKAKVGIGKKQIEKLFEITNENNLPQNIEIVKDGVGHKLLEKASVVIGFNTTSVFESIAAGIPTIVPNIFSKKERLISNYTHDVNKGALVPKNTNQLKSMILKTLNNNTRYKNLTEGQKYILNRVLGNNDGNAGKRLRKFLDDAIEGRFLN